MPTPSGSDPNLGSFNELGATAAAGGILGTNHLQDAINKLVQAVTEFDTVVNKLQGVGNRLAGGSGLSGAWNNNGMETFAKANQGVGGNFNLAGPAMRVTGVTSMGEAGGPNMGGVLGGVCTNTGGGAYKGYGQASGGSGGGGAFPGAGGATATGGGGGGGYGPSQAGFPGLGPTPGQNNVWARATNGGGSTPSRAATFGALGATVVAAAAGFAVNAGKAQMSSQIALNTAQQQAQLMSPLGSNYGQNQQAYSNAIYGTQGKLGGQASYSGWGNNGPDIAATYTQVGRYTGMTPTQLNAAPAGSPGGQIMQGVGTLNYLNPGMGGQRAASLAQSMISPQMSLNMRGLGYPVTPLKPGGAGANGTGDVIGGMMSRWGWGANNRLSPNQMMQSMTSGAGYYNLKAMGYTDQQIPGIANEVTAYGRLYEGAGGQKPLTSGQADQLFSGLKAKNPQIRQQTMKTLQKYGIGQSDISAMQGNAGSQAATLGDQSAGFTKGLKDATGALEQFRKVIGQINNSAGTSGAIGFGKGFGAMMSSGRMTNLGGGMIGGAGMSLLLRMLMGGGGAATKGAEAGGSVLSRILGLGGGGSSALWSGRAGAGIGAGTALGAVGAGAAGFGVQKGMEHAARGHGKSGNMLGDLLGLANPFNFGGWHKDISGLWHGLFGGDSSIGGNNANTTQFQNNGKGPVTGSTVAGGGSNKSLMTTGKASRPAMAAVKAAESQIGVPYKWGAEQPGKGFDCGGLTQWAYRQAGIQLPRAVEDQWKFLQGRGIDPKAVQEGDLVFGVTPGGNPNNPTHVGIMISPSKVLEAPYSGGQIGVKAFLRSHWQRAARPAASMTNTSKNVGGAASSNKNSPTSSGAIADRAQTYNGHKYVWGGGANPDTGFDCSSFVNMLAGMEGLHIPGNFKAPSQSHGPATTQWLADGTMQKIPPDQRQRNDIYVSSTHMGVVLAKGQGFAARSTATGTGPQSDSGEPYQYLRFPGGTAASSGGSNQPAQGGGGSTSPQFKKAAQAGMGENTSEGSTQELAAWSGAVAGGISAGSPWSPNAVTPAAPAGGSGGGGGNAPPGSGTGGSAVYNYLLQNLFGGNKIAAAGATASIWGESGWNPESKDCVPLTYKVVTNRGILAHDEVRVGDTTPVFDPTTRQVVDAVIEGVPYHPGARLCRFGNADWSVTCTWDHKWIVKDGGLLYAAWLFEGSQIMVGEDWYETVEFFEDMGIADNTFCLTTDTGTWTAYRDEQVAEDEGVKPGPFWTGNTGGRGLIGWTPYSTLPDADFTGNAAADMAKQLPEIINFVKKNGRMGAVDQMKQAKSLSAAANIWMRQVEVAGISDVHSQGLAQAAAIAGIPNNYRGGPMGAGSYSLVGERGPEVVFTPKASQVLDASQSRKLMMSAQGPHSAGPASGYNYSSLHRAFSGGGGKFGGGGAAGGGCVVNINTLNLGGGGNASGTPGVTTGQSPSWIPNGILNTQNPARTFAKYIAGLIEQETMHGQISGGVNA